MEILYANHWSESYMVGGNHLMLPITDHYDTKEYEMKLRHLEEVYEWQREWKEIGVEVRNDVPG